MNKKLIGIITALVVVLVLVIGGIVGYNMYRNNQIEKQYNELQSQYDKATDLAKKSVEHIVSADESKLATYKDKIADKKMSEKDMKAFAKTVKAIDKAYADSKTECESNYKNTTQLYEEDSHDELYAFTDEFTKKYEKSLADYDKAFKDGDYRTANDIITKMYGDIVAFQKECEEKASEKELKEAEEQKSTNNEENKTSTTVNNNSNNTSNGCDSEYQEGYSYEVLDGNGNTTGSVATMVDGHWHITPPTEPIYPEGYVPPQ